MTRYVWWQGEWVSVAREVPKPRLAIISDGMNPLRHPVSGAILDSKSQFRAMTREAGCVELGNDAPIVTKPRQTDRKALRNDINQAISELEAGRPAPVSRSEAGYVRKYGE